MRLEPHESSDDLLDRAITAVRELIVPEGPSQETVGRTLVALRSVMPRASIASAGTAFWRWPARIAAVIVLATVGLAVYVVTRPSKSPSPIAGQIGMPSNNVAVSTRPAGPVQSAIAGGPVDPAPSQFVQKPRNAPTTDVTHGPGEDFSTEPATPAMLATIGSLRGRVLFEGPAPTPAVNPWKATKECLEHHHGVPPDESLVVGTHGGVANVVVSVVAGLPEGREWPAPTFPAYLDQEACRFTPHVVTMRVGQDLLARNSDPFLHNVRTALADNDPFNIAQPNRDVQGRRLKRVKAPDIFQVKCDVHPWMSAWVVAFEHPFYALSDDDGMFAIHNLPPGRYTLRAWHEKLGVSEQDVTIEPGEPVAVTFAFDQGK